MNRANKTRSKSLSNVKAVVTKVESQKDSANTVAPIAPRAKVVNPMLDNITPIQPGLTLVSCHSPAILPYARNAITLLAKTCSKKLGVPMPKAGNVLCLYSGHSRVIESAKALDAACGVYEKQAKHDFRVIGTLSGFDYCTDEGFATLLPIISEATGWVILEQPITVPPTPALLAGLSRIRHAAKTHGVWVMIILTCQQSNTQADLEQFCDEFIVLGHCQQEEGYHAAFSFDFVNFRDLNVSGVGRTMCSVKWTGQGLKHRFEPYISQKLDSRVMWLLRKRGQSMEQIAKTLDTNKSKVSRELQKLPPPGFANMTEAWDASHLASIAILAD